MRKRLADILDVASRRHQVDVTRLGVAQHFRQEHHDFFRCRLSSSDRSLRGRANCALPNHPSQVLKVIVESVA